MTHPLKPLRRTLLDDGQVLGGTRDPVEGAITVDIHHFSRYALCIR